MNSTPSPLKRKVPKSALHLPANLYDLWARGRGQGMNGAWQLECVRNRGGSFSCDVLNPNGRRINEPLSTCAARTTKRVWINPPAELEHIRELAAFIAGRNKYSRASRRS